MARTAISMESGTWQSSDTILTRGNFEARPVTLDDSAFTNGVCKAGTPIKKDGTIANDGTAKGMLLNDVIAKENKTGAVLVKAYVSLTRAESSSGLTIASAFKTAFPMIIFE